MNKLAKFPRRQFLHLTAGAAALSATSRSARAQAYPSRAVRIIVGYAGGGTIDILARLTGQLLSERLRQPFVIENRPGASSNIATEAVVKAPPDGYTLLVGSTTNAINATLYDSLPYNFLRDIVPIAGLAELPLVLDVNTSLPVNTLAEFISYAKANPGKISFASFGAGTIALELDRLQEPLDEVLVPLGDASLIIGISTRLETKPG